jgi:hypothetical protein
LDGKNFVKVDDYFTEKSLYDKEGMIDLSLYTTMKYECKWSEKI